MQADTLTKGWNVLLGSQAQGPATITNTGGRGRERQETHSVKKYFYLLISIFALPLADWE